MSTHLFLEEGEYFCFCEVSEEADGKFVGWVTFELRADHAAARERINAMRHRVTPPLNDRDQAMSAASRYAIERARIHDTGL